MATVGWINFTRLCGKGGTQKSHFHHTPFFLHLKYSHDLDQGPIIVLTSVLGLLLAVQALTWAFGYRKAMRRRTLEHVGRWRPLKPKAADARKRCGGVGRTCGRCKPAFQFRTRRNFACNLASEPPRQNFIIKLAELAETLAPGEGKWRDVNLAATVLGWARRSVAEEILNKMRRENAGDVGRIASSEFAAFMRTKPANSLYVTAAQRETLFTEFLQRQQKQHGGRPR